MSFVTVDDVLEEAYRTSGKRLVIPNELRAAISWGLLKMKEAGSQPANAPYDNMAADVISNRLKPHFIETNLK